jgi:ABC-type lipoprotein release transport system permease subunit
VTWLLIFRNITRNKKNSLIIFALIALITSLFFIGNSVIGQTNLGLKRTYIDSLTADVIIQKTGDMSMNLFGANSPVVDAYAAIPVLPAHSHIAEIADAEEGVERRVSLVSSRALLEIPGLSGGREPALLCGVEPESYFDCFPGVELVEGRFLKSGEYGAMITVERADRLERETGGRPVPGTPVLLTAGGNAGVKIREAPLVGIFRYRNPGQFMSEIVIADPQTVRVLAAIQLATAPVSGEGEEGILGNVEDLFAGPEPENGDGVSAEDYGGEGFSPERLSGFLASAAEDLPSPGGAEFSGGDWNFMLLRLKRGAAPAAVIRSLNKKLAPLGVYAAGWRTAAGTPAIMILLLQSFFNLGGFLVSLAGIIVVVNILLISVFRRTREIGALRAIGASASYIRLLIMGENCLISFLAGAAGVAAGGGVLGLINLTRLTISNELVASLLGGGPLHIAFIPSIALASFCAALVLGAAASVYPVETAVRIDPITAVRQG